MLLLDLSGNLLLDARRLSLGQEVVVLLIFGFLVVIDEQGAVLDRSLLLGSSVLHHLVHVDNLGMHRLVRVLSSDNDLSVFRLLDILLLQFFLLSLDLFDDLFMLLDNLL